MYWENSEKLGVNPAWHKQASPKLAVKPIQFALEHQKFLYWVTLLFPLLALLLIGVAKLKPYWYMVLNREDGLVEWATAIVYLGATVFAISLVLSFWRRKERRYALLYAGLAVGMIFVAMEEVSWGQRLLGIDTPEFIAEINLQGETTFHNVDWFPLHEAYIVIGFYGAFSRMIAGPILGRRYPHMVNLLTPPRALFLYFFIPFLLYAYYEFLWYTQLVPNGLNWGEYWTQQRGFLSGDDQESIELLLSIGFLLFTIVNWIRYRVGAPFTLYGSNLLTGTEDQTWRDRQPSATGL
jgi:hypothetical protein